VFRLDYINRLVYLKVIPVSLIDLLYDTIRSLDKDNIGGKLCGAGGGGFLLFVIPPKLIDKIQHDFAYSYTGVRIKTDTKGVKVLYEY